MRYLSEWVGLRQTADNKCRFDERMINKSKTENIVFFLFHRELDEALYCVEMGEKLGQL